MHKIALCLFFINATFSKVIEIKCPSLCECDEFEDLRRASCINQKIVTIEADIPKEVQILDMSHNQISDLEESIFINLGYTELKLLNLSHNKISNIHMNAFRNLHSLKTVDLSHNSVQYILPHWFWDTKSVLELYLSHNNLFSIANEQLECASLKVLDISNCNLNQISIYAFNKVPNLERVDLSGNHLTKLSIDLIKPLNNLSNLNIANNSFTCNGEILEIIDYCKAHNINANEVCHDPFEKEEKFQRMIIQAPGAKLTHNEKNSWLYEERNNSIIIQTNDCFNNTSSDTVLSASISFALWIFCTFIIGYILGIITGCCARKPNQRIKSRLPRYDFLRNTRNFRNESGLINNVYELSLTTPIPQRRNMLRN